MTTTYLNIFGVRISVSSTETVASWLAHDYANYSTSEKNISFVDTHFNLYGQSPDYSGLSSIRATTYHDDYIVYDSGGNRIIDFFGEALVIYDTVKMEINIYCANDDRLYEIFYLSFETWLTEDLGKRGYHSIHCLGLEKDNRAVLILLPPGGGKSTLAFRFLVCPDVRVLSDDIVLFRGGKLYGLHFRFGSRERPIEADGRVMNRSKHSSKYLINIDSSRLASWALPADILIGYRQLTGESRIGPSGRYALFSALFKNMVLGLELQQSLAFFLLRNWKDGFSKADLGLSRLWAMVRLFSASRSFALRLGPDQDKNYDLVHDFISSREH